MRKLSLYIFLLPAIALFMCRCSTEKLPEPEIIEQAEVIFQSEELKRFCLEHFDYDGDGVFTNYEAAAIPSLDLRESNLTTLPAEDLKHFRKLRELNVSGLQLGGTLTIPDSLQLHRLWCSDCGLTELKIPYQLGLQVLDVSNNPLTDKTFSVVMLNYLQELDLTNNGIDSLALIPSTAGDPQAQITGPKNLRKLRLAGNLISSGYLDVSWLKELEELRVDSCGLDSIGTIDSSSSTLTKLTTLSLGANNLKDSVNFSHLAALTYLDCSDMEITELYIDRCRALETLYCGGNSLIELNIRVNNLLSKLDCAGNTPANINILVWAAFDENFPGTDYRIDPQASFVRPSPVPEPEP